MMATDVTKFHKHHQGGRDMLKGVCVCAEFHTGMCVQGFIQGLGELQSLVLTCRGCNKRKQLGGSAPPELKKIFF